ncbi:MAG: ArsA family ATPase [Thermoplasmata archaeon]|nr:MAG: ArsA family ATPase [Thermoplasmata archaeon]
MRTILFTGKGGVGKTTVAAATALLTAKQGKRTMIMSTDAAHSLSDSFETQLSGVPTKITRNLHGLEVDVQMELDTHWAEIECYITELLRSQGIDDITSRELAIVPGMEIVSGLFYIDKFKQEGEYDVLIIDTAPTADTIRLLALPDAVEWYFKHFFEMNRRTSKVLRGTVSRLVKMPMPSDDVYANVLYLYNKIKRTREHLVDADQTSIRLVLNPEKMVINESQRALNYLSLFGYHVESIIANKIIPKEVDDDYFQRWKKDQKEYMKNLKSQFSPIPILNVPMFNKEILGPKMLMELADTLYKGTDPTKVLSKTKLISTYRQKGNYVVSLKLPFARSQDVQLHTKSDELIVKVGNIKRIIWLPHAIEGKEPKEAKFFKGRLLIKFEGD